MARLEGFSAVIGMALVVLMLSLATTACDGGVSSAPRAPVVVRVDIFPSTVEIDALGDTIQFQARAISDRGGILWGLDFEWSSSDPDIVRVDGSGRTVALTNGVARVSAATELITGTSGVGVEQRPTTVRVDPAVSPLVPGNSLPLTAEVLDRRGTVILDPALVWESSDPSVAEVDSLGRVRAVALGQAVIRARSEDALGEARVHVVDPGWPHRPSGLLQASDNPWTILAPTGWGHLNRAAESVVVDDSTAPLSPSGVLEFVYPAGFTAAGMEPAVHWMDVGGAREVFVGMWWKVNPTWQSHESGINKILFIWDPSHQASVVFSMRGPPNGPWFIRPVLQGHPDAPVEYLEQNQIPVPVVPGQWHRLEFHLVVGPGSTGALRWWQDGAPAGAYDSIGFMPTGFGQVELAPTWGGVGTSPKARRDHIRIDHTFLGIRRDPR